MYIIIYRSLNGPVLIASPNGGMDIEEVAENTPELIKKIPIDIFEGISYELALDVAKFLDFKGPLASAVSHLQVMLYNCNHMVISLLIIVMLAN